MTVEVHANDGAVDRVDPLVRAKGAEAGLRTVALGRHSTLAIWLLGIDSELVFVGDAGTTEASRPSRRLGFEWSNTFAATPWLTLDADIAYARARLRDTNPASGRIPGAIEGVASAAASWKELSHPEHASLPPDNWPPISPSPGPPRCWPSSSCWPRAT